jgi:hypothetical protein
MNFIGLRVGEDDLPATASYDGSIGSWPGTARKDRPTSSLKCALLALQRVESDAQKTRVSPARWSHEN